MRVLVCPDKFAGTLDAAAVAAAVIDGWRTARPADELRAMPLSDGGPGFLTALATAVEGRLVELPTVDGLGRPAAGQVLLASGSPTAYLESAQACGLHLLTPAERDPRRTTSYGLGMLVAATVELGARELVIGLGGSATNDGGAGMLAALGAAPLDDAGYAVPYGGAALLGAASLGGVPRLRDAVLVAATDVDSPLVGPLGASAVYGPQKGASAADVVVLDAALHRFATVLSTLDTCPAGLASLPGAGAAGGLGAAMLATGGRIRSGFGVVSEAVGLASAVADCDLVITGEGSFDEQSLRGKVVAGVASAALERGVPCVVVAGRVDVGRRAAAGAGVSGCYSLADHFGSVDEALARPAEGLRAIAARLATHPY